MLANTILVKAREEAGARAGFGGEVGLYSCLSLVSGCSAFSVLV